MKKIILPILLLLSTKLVLAAEVEKGFPDSVIFLGVVAAYLIWKKKFKK